MPAANSLLYGAAVTSSTMPSMTTACLRGLTILVFAVVGCQAPSASVGPPASSPSVVPTVYGSVPLTPSQPESTSANPPPTATQTAAFDPCKLTDAEVSAAVGYPVEQEAPGICNYDGVGEAGYGVSVIIQTFPGGEAEAKSLSTDNLNLLGGGAISDIAGFRGWAFSAVAPRMPNRTDVAVDLGQGEAGEYLSVYLDFYDSDPTAAATVLAHKLVD
jgi:Protein of unknown function (DUF3558)